MLTLELILSLDCLTDLTYLRFSCLLDISLEDRTSSIDVEPMEHGDIGLPGLSPCAWMIKLMRMHGLYSLQVTGKLTIAGVWLYRKDEQKLHDLDDNTCTWIRKLMRMLCGI